ncbi:MAG: hypothetical protein Ta2A_04850 [Treponemataceae bacterium]|nr:MAG: hypothetical protein Ta2A_04850 [Treponemataceae bacterium]
MWITIIAIVIPLLIAASIIANIYSSKFFLDLFNDLEINKLNKCNYEKMEIVRKRRPVHPNGYTYPYSIVSTEIDYPCPRINIIDDIIEVYGIKNKKKYLVFKTDWSKNNVEELKIIVNNFNDRLARQPD